MGIITHNMLAQFSARQLKITDNNMSKSTERLSSGYRVNRAADDAAGLQISEKMRWQIRGLNKASNNIQDGSSLLQVADGALSEVHDMLHRMNELAVQASNDTNTAEDRQDIQKEIDTLIKEIDRIGDDTEFNTRKIFQGGTVDVMDNNGNSMDLSNIPLSAFHLGDITDVSLNNGPIYPGSRNYLNLSASLDENVYSNMTFDLIYGRGNTSHSSIRVEYLDDNGNTVTVTKDLDDLAIVSETYQPSRDESEESSCERIYKMTDDNGLDFEIKQEIAIGRHTGTSQDYKFKYSCKNNSGREVNAILMFNADSAYNNQDRVERYYIGGQSVDNFTVFTKDDAHANQNSSYIHDLGAFQNEGSFSIIDVQNALPFSVKVSWDNSTAAPTTVSIGDWTRNTYEWEYYDNLPSKLGGSTRNQDLAFSLFFNHGIDNGGIPDGGDWSDLGSFNYGFAQTSTDTNLAGVPITYNQTPKVHTDTLNLWIQSGATNQNGMFISIKEMDSDILGISGLDATTYQRAQSAINSVQSAIDTISEQRSLIGAQQNRLEHARRNDDNIYENTQAAESRIRDADMAEEMVGYAKHNILQQAGQSMLSQANQLPNGILQLLQ